VLEGALKGLAIEPAELDARLNVTLGKAGFRDPAVRTGELSGGWLKRLAIARALVARRIVTAR